MLGRTSAVEFVSAPARAERHGDVVSGVVPFDTEYMPRDVAKRLRLDARFIAAASSNLGALRRIADLSASLVTVEPDAIDDAIVDSLRQVAEGLQLDRAVIWQQAASTTSARASHCWIKAPQPAAPELFPLEAGPFIFAKLEAGHAIRFTQVDELPDPAAREALARCGFRSAAIVPMVLTDAAPGVLGVLAFGSTTARHEWTPATVEQLRLVSGVVSQALARKASLQALRQAQEELRGVRERRSEDDVEECPGVVAVPGSRLGCQIQTKHPYRPREVAEQLGDGPIVGRSPALDRVLAQLGQVAATNSTVLLRGETGTGKELLATHLHELSARHQREMVRVNCSAIPTTLLESELFGREKGAFTGALARQIGRFELADQSTIFLDEIGDLPADVQVKLLRVLEERQIERLGNPKGIRVDVRIIAATHRNLEERIAGETFREDLFYRLNVFPIQVPPLRDRAEDIPLLVWRFVTEFAQSFGKRIDTIRKGDMAALQQYGWPGNIRELRNVVERAMIVATGTELTIALPAASGSAGAGKHSLRMADVEREHVRSVLESSHWRVRGSGGAAERLGLRPTTLETRMIKMGLNRPRPSQA